MARKIIERIERIDQLVRLKATGPPSKLARLLEISESALYETISLMKERGAPLIYDKIKNSYIYNEEGKLEVRFKKKYK